MKGDLDISYSNDPVPFGYMEHTPAQAAHTPRPWGVEHLDLIAQLHANSGEEGCEG